MRVVSSVIVPSNFVRRRNSVSFWMHRMADTQILTVLLLACIWASTEGQLNRLKVPSHRTGSSKFSLNPLKPFMKFMRQDPMKAAAQRVYPKYLPPPQSMYQSMAMPSRATIAAAPYGMHPYRPYPSQHSRLLPPSTISLLPHYAAQPSSLMLSALVNDHHHYRPMPSDVQYKAVRIPSKIRRPAASMDSLNIADSVVRQLLDNYQQQQLENNNPSVLVIEDADVTSSSGQTEIFGDSLSGSQSQKVVLAPPLHAEYADSSADMSSNSASNPEVFVIVSKNKNKNNNYYLEDKKADILGSSSSSPKLKKYKIASSYDENGGRQVWIIK